MKNSQVEDFNVTSTARGHLRMNHTFTVLQYSFQTPRNQITKVGSHKHSQQQIEPSQKQVFFKAYLKIYISLIYNRRKYFQTSSSWCIQHQVTTVYETTCMSDSLSTSIQQQVKTVYETTCLCLIHCQQVFSRWSQQSLKPHVYVWFTVDKYSGMFTPLTLLCMVWNYHQDQQCSKITQQCWKYRKRGGIGSQQYTYIYICTSHKQNVIMLHT